MGLARSLGLPWVLFRGTQLWSFYTTSKTLISMNRATGHGHHPLFQAVWVPFACAIAAAGPHDLPCLAGSLSLSSRDSGVGAALGQNAVGSHCLCLKFSSFQAQTLLWWLHALGWLPGHGNSCCCCCCFWSVCAVYNWFLERGFANLFIWPLSGSSASLKCIFDWESCGHSSQSLGGWG